MSGMVALIALVVSIAAAVMLKACRDTVRTHEERLEGLARQIRRLEESSGREVAQTPGPPRQETPAVVSTLSATSERRQEAPVPPPVDVPAHPALPEVPGIFGGPKREALHVVTQSERAEIVPPPEGPPPQPPQAPKSLFDSFDRERWAAWEARLGKQWMTWAGAVVLFLSVGFFVKYAFEHRWLGEGARVIMGMVAGIGVLAAGERFIRRQMRALGQGLVGAGLAILYVSLFAAYGLYGLLPQSVTFLFMAVVTAGGVALAVIHDAVAVSFLAVLGGFLTPVLLRTGRDPRDALFAYLLLLDLGVLGVAFFKRWRALDVLAFLGTAALFTGWYFTFRHAPTYATVPTVLWLAVFYAVFLVQPFIYHLRLATPIVGERFFLAVSNAAGMFWLTYTILHAEHRHALGLITLGMSASYLVLGSLTRKRLRGDDRAVLGFVALSVLLLTIAIPIHLDFDGVTVAWAAEAPVLLYLAYKYLYFPVRPGVLLVWALAAGRIFTIHWPLHESAFTPIVNAHFGTAFFVALAGGAYALVHQWQRKNSGDLDQVLKLWTGIASAFLALAVLNIEVWQWLDLSGRGHLARWACALVCTAGAAAFLGAGIRLSSVHSRMAGLIALAAAGTLEAWDYSVGIVPGYPMIFNGRFLAGLAVPLMAFVYAFMLRRRRDAGGAAEQQIAHTLYGIGILLLVILMTAEVWLWLDAHGHEYLARCLVPLIWVAGAAGYLSAGFRLRSFELREIGLAVLAVAGMFAGTGYAYRVENDILLALNGRFAAALAVALMAFLYAFALRRRRDLCDPIEQRVSEALYGIGIALLFVLLSGETYLYLRETLADRERARWAAQTSLSVTWGVYAIALLAIGFWRNVRTLRLAALGLFGLTALKLVLVDMAEVQEVYRIVSFLVLGILMIGASYLYHRVEQRLNLSSPGAVPPGRQ